MKEPFALMLAAGGHANSLGRAPEVLGIVIKDKTHLPQLYACLFDDDAWVRMRAADVLEKVCRKHPDWLLPYIDKIQTDLADSTQPSIQWHMAQIYEQVELTDKQREHALSWLEARLSTKDADWIVAANAMDALMGFTRDGHFPGQRMVELLHIQQHHKSSAVIKRANKFLVEIHDRVK